MRHWDSRVRRIIGQDRRGRRTCVQAASGIDAGQPSMLMRDIRRSFVPDKFVPPDTFSDAGSM
jgi:hypothetical protein